MSQRFKTLEEARADLDRRGLTVAEWARQNGLQSHNVYALFKGKSRGVHGEARRAAVLLGMAESGKEESAYDPA